MTLYKEKKKMKEMLRRFLGNNKIQSLMIIFVNEIHLRTRFKSVLKVINNTSDGYRYMIK